MSRSNMKRGRARKKFLELRRPKEQVEELGEELVHRTKPAQVRKNPRKAGAIIPVCRGSYRNAMRRNGHWKELRAQRRERWRNRAAEPIGMRSTFVIVHKSARERIRRMAQMAKRAAAAALLAAVSACASAPLQVKAPAPAADVPGVRDLATVVAATATFEGKPLREAGLKDLQLQSTSGACAPALDGRILFCRGTVHVHADWPEKKAKVAGEPDKYWDTDVPVAVAFTHQDDGTWHFSPER